MLSNSASYLWRHNSGKYLFHTWGVKWMIFSVIAVFTLYLQYTSVYLCIRVKNDDFYWTATKSLSMYFVHVSFVQYDFIFQVDSFCYWIFNISPVLLVRPLIFPREWIQFVQRKNIFKTSVIPPFFCLAFVCAQVEPRTASSPSGCQHLENIYVVTFKTNMKQPRAEK